MSGSTVQLCDAIRRGADLRIYTEFLFNEHIDTSSDCDERIREVSEFAVTYLLQDSWVAGIMNLRHPLSFASGFGVRPSMSFFLYNQNGQQAIARPHLDGLDASERSTASRIDHHPSMSKMHVHDSFDDDTNAPCRNFIYDFDVYRFHVHDRWQEVLSHASDGTVISGSLDGLVEAFADGSELKVSVKGFCDPLARSGQAIKHEVFVQAGPGYYFMDRKLFVAGSHPIVRVRPAAPLLYESRGWDFGWLSVRTNGQVFYRRCDPYTLGFQDITSHHALRWFVAGR